MQVFISHKIEGDSELAVQLKTSLAKEGIFGYVAELKQEYDILISDKIKEEINKSKYLVAIFTENSINSASVHEETTCPECGAQLVNIGFARLPNPNCPVSLSSIFVEALVSQKD